MSKSTEYASADDEAALHLIPVSLASTSHPDRWLPQKVQSLAANLDHFVAENAKTARAFLKQIKTQHALPTITIHTLKAQSTETEMRSWLQPLAAGRSIGLVSEAGCPAVADPGARVVSLAHRLGYRVVPHVGPSSILLGLMASGLEGQQFAFHGYAPIDALARTQQLKLWESYSKQQQQTQILIETPYRNQALFDALTRSLRATTLLCLARDLTGPNELITTRSIADWKRNPPSIWEKHPTLFLFLAR